MEILQKIALTLAIIGALNWGLVGLFHFDVVAQLGGGSTEMLPRFIYVIIGIAGIMCVRSLFSDWREKNNRVQVIELEKT